MSRVHHGRGPGAEAVSDCLAERSTSSLFSMTGSNNCELILSYLRYLQRGHQRGNCRTTLFLEAGIVLLLRHISCERHSVSAGNFDLIFDLIVEVMLLVQ